MQEAAQVFFLRVKGLRGSLGYVTQPSHSPLCNTRDANLAAADCTHRMRILPRTSTGIYRAPSDSPHVNNSRALPLTSMSLIIAICKNDETHVIPELKKKE